MQLGNKISRPQLADTTSGREGAALVGTDTKTHLNNATDVETALNAIDTFVADTLTDLDGAADLVGFNDWRPRTLDPFEIRSNYGLSIHRQGDVYFVDYIPPDDGLTSITGGQGITVVQDGSDFTIHAREPRLRLTDADDVTLDLANTNHFLLQMVEARPHRTLHFTNGSDGQRFTLLLIQGANNTVTWWPMGWANDTEPTLSTDSNISDLFEFELIEITPGFFGCVSWILGQHFGGS